MGRNRSLLVKMVGKGTAGSSKGIENQPVDIRVGKGVKNT